MHNAFGNDGNSMLATEEAVRVAHQNSDGSAVAFALRWLQANKQNALPDKGEELLRRCRAKALQHNLSNLASSASLTISALLRKSKSVTPTQIWDSLDWKNVSGESVHSGEEGYTGNSSGVQTNGFVGTQNNSVSLEEIMLFNSKRFLSLSGSWSIFGHQQVSGAKWSWSWCWSGNVFLHFFYFSLGVHLACFGPSLNNPLACRNPCSFAAAQETN